MKGWSVVVPLGPVSWASSRGQERGSCWPVSPVTRYKHSPLHTSHQHRRIYTSQQHRRIYSHNGEMMSNDSDNMNNMGTEMAKNYQSVHGNGKLSKPGRKGRRRCEVKVKSTHIFQIWHQAWNIKCAGTRTASAEMTSGLATGLHLSRDMICNSLLISKYLSDWLINKLYRYQNEFIHYQAAWWYFNFGKENKNRAWKHSTTEKFCISGAWCCLNLCKSRILKESRSMCPECLCCRAD